MKELQFNLGECGKDLPKKDDQLIELILTNLKTPYDVLCSIFRASQASKKEDSKDYTFNYFCGLFAN